MKYLYLILFIPALVFGQDLKKALLEYDYVRVRLTNASKSKIIDLIKKSDFDSVDVIVNFCDSINSPNLGWLTKKERFFLEVLKENLDLLEKDSLYKELFWLNDTLPSAGGGRPRYRRLLADDYELGGGSQYDLSCLKNPPPVPTNESLIAFLELSFIEKFKELKEKYPNKAYIWDFMEIIFYQTNYYAKRHQGPVVEYLRKYKDSPFYKLVLYNYYYNYELTKSGTVLGLGGGYLDFNSNTNKLFRDRGNVYLYWDIFTHGVPLKMEMLIMTNDLESRYIQGTDTVPRGTAVTNPFLMLSTGYLFHLNNNFHVTPYAGVGWFLSSLPDTEKDELGTDIDFRSVFGYRTGASLDIRFKSSLDYQNIDASMWGFRIDAGLGFFDHSKLKAGLGKTFFYVNIGISVLGWGEKRTYEFKE
jgi:hypothetical protein